jgi:hypothetical protein
MGSEVCDNVVAPAARKPFAVVTCDALMGMSVASAEYDNRRQLHTFAKLPCVDWNSGKDNFPYLRTMSGFHVHQKSLVRPKTHSTHHQV